MMGKVEERPLGIPWSMVGMKKGRPTLSSAVGYTSPTPGVLLRYHGFIPMEEAVNKILHWHYRIKNMSKASLPQQDTTSRWLKQHKFIIYQYGDLKSKLEVLAGMIFSETFPSRLADGNTCCHLTWHFLNARASLASPVCLNLLFL